MAAAVPFIPAAVSVIGGVMGQNAARDIRNQADAARRDALAQFANIQVPSIEDQRLNLSRFQSAGELSPEMLQTIASGPSAYENISVDPRLRANQIAALEQVAKLASGGMNEADMAAFELARRNSAAEAQAKEGQIIQNLQSRGQGGSGAELIARLQSQESAADRLQQADLEQAKAMQNARLAALSNQANLAGSIRSADYSQATDLAKAKDIINQFNINNARDVQASNVAARNAANAANLASRQKLAEANVNLANLEQEKNKALLQQQFENQYRKAGGSANIYQNQANALTERAGQEASGIAGIASGVGGLVKTGMEGISQSDWWKNLGKKDTPPSPSNITVKPEDEEIGWR